MSFSKLNKWFDYCLLGGMICLISYLASDKISLSHRYSDSLFLSGVILMSVGGIQLILRLGIFDLLIFSFQAIGKHSPKQVESSETDNSKEPVSSYHSYLSQKKKSKDFVVPMLIGISFIILSICSSLLGLH